MNLNQNEQEQLDSITRKVEAGERISFDEGVFLDEKVDILTLGDLANRIRERKNGNFAYYNTNIHLNPTNVCVYRCKFLCISCRPEITPRLHIHRRDDS